MRNKHKIIGILGGMGPDASVRLYQLMINMARGKYGASRNEDYPEILIDSVPVPDFISNIKKRREALSILRKRVKKLDRFGVSSVGIACNTVHTIIPDLTRETDVPFISIADEMVRVSKEKKYKKIGLLASPTTIRSALYKEKFSKVGIRVVIPNSSGINELGEIIADLVAGKFEQSKDKVVKIANSLKAQRVDAIALGCTELPLVFPQEYSLPVLNSLEILADALLIRYYGKKVRRQ